MKWSRGRRGAQSAPSAEAAHTPDPVADLTRDIEQAQARLAAQSSTEAGALITALSEQELAAERDLAVSLRSLERQQRARAGKAAAAAADAAREVDSEITAADHRDILAARKALARQRRAASPHAKLARLDSKRAWSLRGLGGVVAMGMVWSAINVQYNFVHHTPDQPLRPNDLLYWASFGIEGMVSVCLVALLVGVPALAEWGVKLGRKTTLAAEGALLLLTLGLNTYPFVSPEWQGYDVAVHSIAPGMIAVAMMIYHALSDGYAVALDRATAAVPADVDLLAERRTTATVLPAVGPAALPAVAGLGVEQSSAEQSSIRTAAPTNRATGPSSPIEQAALSSNGTEQSYRAIERIEHAERIEQSSTRGSVEHIEHIEQSSIREVEQAALSSIAGSEANRTEQFASLDPFGPADTEPLPVGAAGPSTPDSWPGWGTAEQSGTGAEHPAEQGRGSVLSQWSASSAAARGPRTGHPEQVARDHAEHRAAGPEVEHSAVLGERSAEQVAAELAVEFAEVQAARRGTRAGGLLGGGESSTRIEQSSTMPSGPVEHIEQSSKSSNGTEQSYRAIEQTESSTGESSTESSTVPSGPVEQSSNRVEQSAPGPVAEGSGMTERAAEVAEMAHSRVPLDKVAAVLAAADADASMTPSKIARATGVSFGAVSKLIDADTQRSRGAEVIALRKS